MKLKWFFGVVTIAIILAIIAILAYAPIGFELHTRNYRKGIHQIAEKLGDPKFSHVKVLFGKGPDYPIVVEGYVESKLEQQQAYDIVEPFKSAYRVDFRVQVREKQNETETNSRF